ncbi:MAG TPA: glycosyltransferase, partial [Candidatus Paceibacterota bacterium]|nr:glycosyltransferase [Candidatus Paceibacterota bacterium]
FQGQPTSARKKILFVITQSEMGGAQMFLLQLLTHLRRDAYDLTIAVGSDGDGSFSHALSGIGITPLIIKSLKRDPNLLSDIRAIYELRDIINSLQPATLFLLSSKAGFIGSLAGQLARKRPTVIYRIGGWTFNDPWPVWKKQLWKALERTSSPWKDYIIVNNTHDLIQARQFHIEPAKGLELIYNGIEPYGDGGLAPETARAKLLELCGLSANDTSKIACTIANFYPAKGLETLLEAAALLKNENLIFIIIGDGHDRPKLQQKIAALGLQRSVFLPGHLENARQYLPGANVFVLPSLKEGFPWSVLEAMAAKIPVVATRVGAVPEVLDNGKSGIVVEPSKPTEMKEAILTILHQENLAREMVIQAHQTLVKSFSITSMVEKIETLL